MEAERKPVCQENSFLFQQSFGCKNCLMQPSIFAFYELQSFKKLVNLYCSFLLECKLSLVSTLTISRVLVKKFKNVF